MVVYEVSIDKNLIDIYIIFIYNLIDIFIYQVYRYIYLYLKLLADILNSQY